MKTTENILEAKELMPIHECDHNCIGDALIDRPIEEVNAEIDAMAALQAEGADEWPEANFIVDIFHLHTDSQLTIRPEHLLIAGVKHLHDSFRNRNEFYRTNGVDTKINFSVGNIYYINGEQVWGQVFRNGGVAHSGTQGVNHMVVMDYCKELAGTQGDGSRYAMVVPWRISGPTGSPNIAGFAYVGSHLHTRHAGQWTASQHVGAAFSKTPIHEMGHSAALWHTFHATNNCGPETNPSLQGDRIPDTPPETRNTSDPCFNINAPNHMSYGNRSSRWYFTPMQAERMRLWLLAGASETFNNPRVYWPDEEQTTPLPEPIIAMSLSSDTIQQGENLVVEWTTEHADYVELDGLEVATSGSVIISPTESGSVTLLASNDDHIKTKTKDFTVVKDVDLSPPNVTVTDTGTHIRFELDKPYDRARIRVRLRPEGPAQNRVFEEGETVRELSKRVLKNQFGTGIFAFRVWYRVAPGAWSEFSETQLFRIE